MLAHSFRHETHKAEPVLGDLRFRNLLSASDWANLPPDVRRRFSKRVAGGATAVYVGSLTEGWISRAGWWLAQLLRPLGGPLPTSADINVPSIVTVTEDMRAGGQVWTRLYARRSGFPQVIHSAKRFSGPTGLEEYIGFGIAMALRASVEDGALVFRSAGFSLGFGKFRLRLPRWMEPGRLKVEHRDKGAGTFLFSLELTHPLLGPLVRQAGLYREEKA